jgi:phosphate transport system permease protein
MASLPSVVLGFLGALWLAQKIETRLPSLLLVALCVPAAALLMGFLWSRLSGGYRRFIPSGWEFLAAFIPLGLVVWGAWNFGPILEQWCFTVTDPTSGAVISDFRRWWAESTGLRFDQRNAVVVGIMMGFAVIPIIFTIAEDAMSNVPKALRSGSLALGASRWQTAMRIVLPTASAGIFSAIMIGLGRAIGETMIVVMATGNTPIMGMNPFDGMRTLSANIAKEMPEAPVDSTLFRTLFLSALLLFAMTFIINTIAELMSEKNLPKADNHQLHDYLNTLKEERDKLVKAHHIKTSIAGKSDNEQARIIKELHKQVMVTLLLWRIQQILTHHRL